MTFDLTDFDPASAMLTGLGGADDAVLDILVNGTLSGVSFTGFSMLTSLTLISGFIDGLNTPDFIVQDGFTPTAFRTDDLTATAAPSTAAAVPEPASWAMFIGGFGVLGAMMRRRRTSITFA